MINVKFFILLIASTAFVSGLPRPETEIITSPEPGQEYVFVQSSGSGSRPIERKDKNLEQERETAHKIPPSLKYTYNQEDDIIETKPIKGKIHKREANPGEGPAPAPAGAIKLDVRKLLEMYKSDLKTSTTTTTAKPKSTSSASKKRGGNNRRVKKEAKSEDLAIATSPSPVLTTAAAVPRKIDLDDIPLVAAGSEKQRSRIQIKKGPNGQDYEYEYVYYYYDDDEDSKDKVSNSHDGPTRNQISRGDKTRGEKTGEKSRTEKTSTAPEANEVVPSASRQRTRGRQLGEEDGVNEERLPANTRFPPRSRNLNTTPLPEEETKATSRGRGRGRPTTESAIPASENDNVSDETQGSRGRTRANVRRPALELVDSASFNTHSNAAGAEPPSGGPSFPTELPAGPVRFLGATPNERMELPADADDEPKKPVVAPAPVSEPEEESETKITTADGEATTVMSPMDKVALDLYAVVQGTQKLSGEDSEATSDDDSTDSVNTEGTTVEAETEVVETTTPTTTTTTTTTTTPAPTTTTTTTTEAPLGRGGKYRPRPGAGRRTSHASSTTETTPAEPTKKSKFARPGFGGRPRLGAKTTPEPAVEQEATKEESKPVSHSRPTVSRARFGGNRARGRTTAAPAETNEETASSSTAAPSHRPALPRARPSFNLRSRGRTTPAPADSEAAGNEEAHESSPAEASSTTVRSRRISAGNSVRPLRPGPKINLAGRGRGAASSTTLASDEHVTSEETASNVETKPTEEESEPQPPADSTPLKRLQNRNRLNVQQRPKAAASAPVQVRRVNPLLGRRRPGQTTEASSSEAPQEAPVTEEAQADEKAETEVPASSSTTEEPKGINKLLAGRRRLTNRQPEPTEKTATVTSTATNLPPSDSVTTDVPERLRPSNRRRIHTPSTEDPIEENLDKSETISIQTKSNVHRSRFHDRTKTLSETSDETDIPKVEPQSIHAPFSRKPSFTSRTRSTTTSIPLNKNEEISQNINTTTPKLIGLRPGPKINFKPRTRRPSLPIVTEHSTEKSVENVEEEESTTTETTSSTKIHTRSRRPYAGRRRSDRVTTTEATEEKSMDKETTTDIVNDRSTTKKETGLTKLFARRRLSVQTA